MLIEVPISRRSSSDRFIPRRANANFDLSYYYIRKSDDLNSCINLKYTEADWFRNTAKYCYNLEHYRSELWKVMMPKENRILIFSSPKKKTKWNSELHHETNLWPVYPRSKPLLGPPSVILDMPDLDTNISHQVVDWGKKGYIATIYENEVHLWHSKDNLRVHVTNTLGRVQTCIKWNSDGTQIALALNMAAIALWDCSTTKITKMQSCRCPFRACVITAVEFTKNNYLITGCSKGRLCSWTPDLVCIKMLFLAHVDDIITIKLSCNENYLATTGIDGAVRMWKWPSLDEIFEITFSQTAIKALDWHPWRDSLLAIGGPVNTTLWNVSTLKLLESKNHPHPNSLLDCLTFNPLSGELVASYFTFGNDGNGIHLLSVLKDLEHVVDEAQFHSGRVPYMLWDYTGTKLATASADENLCIWDFFGTSTDVEKKYLNMSKKKELSTDMLKNLNIFNSCIR